MLLSYLEVGQIVGTHGIAGEMRVQPWCDSPDFLTKFKTLYTDKNGENAVKVKSSRVHKNIVLIKFPDITTIEQAERMRGKVLYISRKDANIADGEWFIQELIGCTVFDADTGRDYGVLSDVSKTGANDVWHIKKDGKEYLLPAINDIIANVDVANEKVEIHSIIKGIFDDEI
ncbi:MAG: ribosome maturation factor RimM [Acutalibacteraceae bacterium]|nr:ribosome maturation factor RimM [Acutalibacteraceae bacterium]